jgi:prohibitin 2
MGTLFLIAFLGLLIGGIAISVVFALTDKPWLKGIPVALASFIFLFLHLSFTEVGSTERTIVTKYGRVASMLAPGAHFINPVTDRVYPVSVQTHTVKPAEDAASRDLQIVHTQITLAYHFEPDHVDYIFTQLADNSENAVENKVIIPAILEAIKSNTAQYDAQQLITERPKVRDGIEAFVVERLKPYHIVAETVSITDFNFSKEFNDSIEAKVTAQQHAEKAQNDLTRIKVEAEQKVAQAQAEAKSLEVQRQQITPELLQLRTIEMMREKWDGHMPQFIGGGSVPMLDVLKAAEGRQK